MEYTCKQDFITPWTFIQSPWPYFWWSWYCGTYSLMVYILLFLKLTSRWWNTYFGLKPLWCYLCYYFRKWCHNDGTCSSDWTLLMYNIIRNRIHDVRESITWLVGEEEGRKVNLKKKRTSEEKLSTPENGWEKTAFLKTV